MSGKIELILLTGFLGSGKTTLLNKLIAHYSDRKIGILVNDFGKLPVDGSIIKARQETRKDSGSKIYEISNGSIFCSCLTASFVLGLKYFIKEAPDLLFVETSGLSDPSGLSRLLSEYQLFDRFHIMKTVCVLDAVRVPTLRKTLEVVDRQIGAAHLILINKTDLAHRDSIHELTKSVRKINPGAEVEHATFCNFDFNLLKQSPHPIKDGALESCNTPESRPADLILSQKEVSKEKFTEFMCAIEKSVLRLKGYYYLDGTLYFITDNAGSIHLRKIETNSRPEPGISLICNRSDLREIEERWQTI